MNGLLFLSSVIAIGWLMWWMHQNDRVSLRGPTHGLFALRSPRGGAPARAWTSAANAQGTPMRPAPRPARTAS